MGTNYFIHIGKRSAAGGGRCEFTYAIPLGAISLFDNVEVIDEYGNEMSVADFFDIIADDKRLDARNMRFS